VVDHYIKKVFEVKKKFFSNNFNSFELIDNINKTPSTFDTNLESDPSITPSSNLLQLPPSNTSHNYPARDTTSSYSRSTLSSIAKYKVYFHLSNLLIIYFIILENININIEN